VSKAVFLDRDGVINQNEEDGKVKYVNSPKDLQLIPGVADAIAIFREKGYLVFVVTNQGGIAAKFMKLETLHDIHQKMVNDLLTENRNAKIDDIVFCPHSTKGHCECRKPKPGMILSLAEKYNIDLSKSYMIGDRETDIQAGQLAGCKTFLVDKEHNLYQISLKIME
jgi:D-glycero-D-manno-heptose 1,7-bisphosphate phosphatase